MRIYEDWVYWSPEIIERPEGFHKRRFWIRPERPDVSSAEERDDLDAGDTSLRAALLFFIFPSCFTAGLCWLSFIAFSYH